VKFVYLSDTEIDIVKFREVPIVFSVLWLFNSSINYRRYSSWNQYSKTETKRYDSARKINYASIWNKHALLEQLFWGLGKNQCQHLAKKSSLFQKCPVFFEEQAVKLKKDQTQEQSIYVRDE
jgi:hypothetical protein